MIVILILITILLPTTLSQSLCTHQTPAAGINTVDCLCGPAVDWTGHNYGDPTMPPQTICSSTPNANGMITGMYCLHSASRCDQVPPCSGALAESNLNLAVADHSVAYPGCALFQPKGLKIIDNWNGLVGTPTKIIGTPDPTTGNLPMLSGGHVNRILFVDGPLVITDVRLVRGRTGECTCTWFPDQLDCEGCGNGGNIGGWPSVGARICKENIDLGGTGNMVNLNKCTGGLLFLGKGERTHRNKDDPPSCANGHDQCPLDFAEYGQESIINAGKECFLNAAASQCFNNDRTNGDATSSTEVLEQSARRTVTGLRVTFEYGTAYQGGAVMVQNGRFKCTDCDMKYNIIKPEKPFRHVGATSRGGAIMVESVLSRLELIRGDIHHNEAFDGAGIYITGKSSERERVVV